MANEIELKLELDPEVADIIAASDVLPRESTTAKQVSVYFDTPDQDLEKAGLTLRIRRSKGKRIQTVKAAATSTAGLFARSEWERPLRNDVPILDDATPIPVLLGPDLSDIAPVFEVHVERQKWDYRDGNALIEVVLDRGYAIADGHRSPVCEIELELQQGDPDALFRLARQLDAIAALRLGVVTKSERGYMLTRAPVTVFKAERVILAADTTAAQAFQQIIQACVRQFRLNEPLVFGVHDSEALHQARVSIRRLRSAFSIFKPVLDDADDKRLREDLRWLASELGDARNLDVLLKRSKPGPLHDRLETARAGAYAKVDEALSSTRARSMMLDLAEWTATGGWLRAPDTQKLRDGSAHEFACAALGKQRRRIKKDGKDLAHSDDETRHELRKDAKKLRYAAEFFGSLFDRKRQKKRYKKFVDALEELQDQLGLLNDLATAPDVFRALGLADDPEAAALMAKGNKSKLIARAAEAHDTLVDTKPFWR